MHNGKQTVDGNTGKTQGDNGERTWIVILIVMAMRWPPFPSLNFQPQKKSLCVYLSAIWRRSRREFEHSNVPEAKKVLSIRNGGPCVRKTRQACWSRSSSVAVSGFSLSLPVKKKLPRRSSSSLIGERERWVCSVLGNGPADTSRSRAGAWPEGSVLHLGTQSRTALGEGRGVTSGKAPWSYALNFDDGGGAGEARSGSAAVSVNGGDGRIGV